MNIDISIYKKILEKITDAVYFVDANMIITYLNKAAEEISGFSEDEIIGKSCCDNILTHIDCDGKELCKINCPLSATIKDNISRETELYMHHKNGHRIPVFIWTHPLTDINGKTIGGIQLFTEASKVSDLNHRIHELEKLAMLDHLTRLANRMFIENEITKRIHEFNRFKTPFGLFFIDIDDFKKFNDEYGHNIGDEVLKFVSNTFILNARPFDLYGRWGGEEFIGIIKNINQRDLKMLGNRIRILIQNSYLMHENKRLSITISIGATIVKKNDTIDSIIGRADSLMYHSKIAGKNAITTDSDIE